MRASHTERICKINHGKISPVYAQLVATITRIPITTANNSSNDSDVIAIDNHGNCNQEFARGTYFMASAWSVNL